MNPGASNPDLRRVAIVGTSCCGKSTFARELATVLDATHIELDALFWKPNWVTRPVAEFRGLVEREASAERWVVDGNYSTVRDLVWRRATDVVWLNYPFTTVFYRALRRTVRRSVTREALYAGNRESFSKSFFSRDSILLWVLKTFRRRRLEYTALRSADEWRHIRFREFRRPPHASEFLSQCGATVQNASPAAIL